MHARLATCTPSSRIPKQGASQQKKVTPPSRTKAIWLDAVILGASRFTGKYVVGYLLAIRVFQMIIYGKANVFTKPFLQTC